MRVVVAGHSNIRFTEPGTDSDAVTLLQKSLSAMAPATDWECVPCYIRMGSGVAQRLTEIVDELRPDVVVLCLTGTGFAYDFVTTHLHRRWRRLYKPALRTAKWLKRTANLSETEFLPRKLLFQLPDEVAYRLLGGEPVLKVESAVAQATAAIDALVRYEDVVSLCRLPGVTMRVSGKRRRLYEQRITTHNAAVSELCRKRHVGVFEMDGELAKAARTPAYARDQMHFDSATRQFEAEVTAGHILRLLNELKAPAALARR